MQTPRKPADSAATHCYEITSMDFFDLFPQTYHIEALVRLRRM
jgi:tRNA/tmRNA/rRNA uracil-C5-methylase (TrmA/RlmC/RlmD family)